MVLLSVDKLHNYAYVWEISTPKNFGGLDQDSCTLEYPITNNYVPVYFKITNIIIIMKHLLQTLVISSCGYTTQQILEEYRIFLNHNI